MCVCVQLHRKLSNCRTKPYIYKLVFWVSNLSHSDSCPEQSFRNSNGLCEILFPKGWNVPYNIQISIVAFKISMLF